MTGGFFGIEKTCNHLGSGSYPSLEFWILFGSQFMLLKQNKSCANVCYLQIIFKHPHAARDSLKLE